MWPFPKPELGKSNGKSSRPINESPEMSRLREAMTELSPSFAYAPAKTLVKGMLRIIETVDHMHAPPVKGFVLQDPNQPTEMEIVAIGACFQNGRVAIEWSMGRSEQLPSMEHVRNLYGQQLRVLWYDPPQLDQEEIHDQKEPHEIADDAIVAHLSEILERPEQIVAQPASDLHNEFSDELSDEPEEVQLPDDLSPLDDHQEETHVSS